MGINYQHQIFGLLTSDAGDYRSSDNKCSFLGESISTEVLVSSVQRDKVREETSKKSILRIENGTSYLPLFVITFVVCKPVYLYLCTVLVKSSRQNLKLLIMQKKQAELKVSEKYSSAGFNQGFEFYSSLKCVCEFNFCVRALVKRYQGIIV